MRYHVKKERKISVKNKAVAIVCGIVYLIGIKHAIADSKTFENNNTESCPEKYRMEHVATRMSSVGNNKIRLETLDGFREEEYYFEEKKSEPVVNNTIKQVKRLPMRIVDPSELEELKKELTDEEKLELVMEYHNIDGEFQYYQIVSAVANEAGPSNYQECYDVICVAFNRTLSIDSCRYCKSQNGGKSGLNVADQLLWRAQFSGFLPNKAGYDRDEYEGTNADEAVLDFLYGIIVYGDLARSNDYIFFNAPDYPGRPSYAIQLNPECKGNVYFGLMTESDLNEKAKELGVELGLDRRSEEFQKLRATYLEEQIKQLESLLKLYGYDIDGFSRVR